MKLNVTDIGFLTEDPLSLSDYGSELDKLLGQYEIKGRNMADRENQLWDLLQYNSNYKLESLTYEKVSPVNCSYSISTN